MPSQTSLLLHVSKPAAAIGLGYHYTAHALIVGHGPPLRRPYDAPKTGTRTCADLGGTSCAGYGTDRPQTRQSIQNIRHCAVDIGIVCRKAAEYRHRRPPTGRTNGRFLCVVLQFFSWRFAGAPSETSRPCLSAYSMQARGPRFGDGLLGLSVYDRL